MARTSYSNRKQTKPNTKQQQSLRGLLQATIALILSAALASVSQLALRPVYGSIPSARYHYDGLLLTAALAALVRATFPGLKPSRRLLLLPIICAWLPIAQHIMFLYSGKLALPWGPLLTELATVYPLCMVAFLQFLVVLERFMPKDIAAPPSAIATTLLFAFILGKKWFEGRIPLVSGVSTGAMELQIILTAGFSLVAPSWYLVLAAPAVVTTIWTSPRLTSGHDATLPNMALHNFGYQLLERHQSVTGYISVLEKRNSFRVMRCDHSLLGGEWLLSEKATKRGMKVKESVFSVFTMLEAVRLIERGESSSLKTDSALFIGLGAGMATKAFIQHGINTTILELDPVVYGFAIRYFDLPMKHIAYLEDAVSFVKDVAVAEQPPKYDYIVHDVFTGGAEPSALFTREFLADLSSLLADNGAIVINYAGDLNRPLAKVALHTIFQVFPSCRIYRDLDAKSYAMSFVNMVVFCTKRAGVPVTFREAVEADYLGSMSRRQYVPPPDKLEMFYADVVGADEKPEALARSRKGRRELSKARQDGAAEHWKIMRNVMPDAVWELW